jgi:hypothetical protein
MYIPSLELYLKSVYFNAIEGIPIYLVPAVRHGY